MPRIARVVVPGLPHHVTQRGNRRADVFFDKPDRQRYLSLLAAYAERHGVAIWAYCLMSNHVHFVAVPAEGESLGRTYRDTHQAYAAWLNRKMGQSGSAFGGAGAILLMRAGRSAPVGGRVPARRDRA